MLAVVPSTDADYFDILIYVYAISIVFLLDIDIIK